MTLKSLPAAPAGRPSALSKRDLPSATMERWNGGIKAAYTDENSISVFDVIGADYWGEGVTASRIAGALRSMNGANVTVNINSPGGDMFEGLAIYNLLREYKGKVTVKVLGLAASDQGLTGPLHSGEPVSADRSDPVGLAGGGDGSRGVPG